MAADNCLPVLKYVLFHCGNSLVKHSFLVRPCRRGELPLFSWQPLLMFPHMLMLFTYISTILDLTVLSLRVRMVSVQISMYLQVWQSSVGAH